jgi:hypothetical protein
MNTKISTWLLMAALVGAPALTWADGVVKLSPLTSPQSTTLSPVQDPDMPLRGKVSAIPKGTMMMVRMDQPISSFTSNVGDAISATLESDVFVNDEVLVPAGSEVIGQVTGVSKSGKLGKHGEIDIRFFSLKSPDGVVIPIRAHIVTKDETGILKGNTYTQDVLKGVGTAVGGTAIGAVLGTASGAILGSVGTGAAMGTALGGVGGIGYALMRQGKDVTLPSGSRVSIVSEQAIAVNP